MKKLAGAILIAWLLLFFWVAVQAGEAAQFPMTPHSGIDISDNGRISIGVETFFPQTSRPGTANISVFKRKLPVQFATLTLDYVSVGLRPPSRCRITDGLFRILLGPNHFRVDAFVVFSVILKSTCEPQNIIAPGFTLKLVPNDRWLFIEFQEAGAGRPTNMELHATGQFQGGR